MIKRSKTNICLCRKANMYGERGVKIWMEPFRLAGGELKELISDGLKYLVSIKSRSSVKRKSI